MTSFFRLFPGYHVVPEPSRQAEARHGGAAEGRGVHGRAGAAGSRRARRRRRRRRGRGRQPPAPPDAGGGRRRRRHVLLRLQAVDAAVAGRRQPREHDAVSTAGAAVAVVAAGVGGVAAHSRHRLGRIDVYLSAEFVVALLILLVVYTAGTCSAAHSYDDPTSPPPPPLWPTN